MFFLFVIFHTVFTSDQWQPRPLDFGATKQYRGLDSIQALTRETDGVEVADWHTCDWYTVPHLVTLPGRVHHSFFLYFYIDFLFKALQPQTAPWWFDTGTLLGIFRHGTLLPWDVDVDVFTGDLQASYTLLQKYSTANKLDLSISLTSRGNSYITISMPRCTQWVHRVDIMSAQTVGGYRHAGGMGGNAGYFQYVRSRWAELKQNTCMYDMYGYKVPLLHFNQTKELLSKKYGVNFVIPYDHKKYFATMGNAKSLYTVDKYDCVFKKV